MTTETTTTEKTESTAAETTTTAATETTAAATVEKTETGTILGDKTETTTEKTVAAPADWPTDWRDKVASQVKPGDSKFRERLDRLASPIDVTKSWLALEQKMSSGEFRQALPKDAKPEQIAQWRKDNGVPEKAENYSVELPGGIKFNEDDKPALDDYLKAAHAQNWTQDQVTQGLMNFHQVQKEQSDRLAAFDTDQRRKGEDELRSEWGADYRRQVNAVDNLIATMPEELAAVFINGRLEDGMKIGADPRIIRWLSSLATEYPTLVADTGASGSSDETRLEEIRTLRRSDPNAYDVDKKIQAEELAILERQTKRGGRRAA